MKELTWSKELPTTPGLYYVQWPYSEPEALAIFKLLGFGDKLYFQRHRWRDPSPIDKYAGTCEFAGPLPPAPPRSSL